MKELSIEEKAKAYDEAYKKVAVRFGSNVADEIFPELKESEDERTWIINYLNNRIVNSTIIAEKENLKKAIAWLEKQGQKDGQVKLPTFTFDDILALQCCMETVKKVQEDKELYEKLNDLHGRVYDAYRLEKQGEQKPAWSEEDEAGLSDAMWAIEQARTIAKDENDMGNLWYAEHWLKSLKDRYTWKPSSEQIEAIRLARSFVVDDFSEKTTLSDILVELEKQLKK